MLAEKKTTMAQPVLRRSCQQLISRLASRSHACTPQATQCTSQRPPILSFSRNFSFRSDCGKSIPKFNSGPQKQGSSSPRNSKSLSLLAASSGLVALGLSFIEPVSRSSEPSSAVDEKSTKNENDTLPYYRLSEVKEHGPKSARPWVTYQGKIYDITDWIPAHPGGEVILRAAGGSIEP